MADAPARLDGKRIALLVEHGFDDEEVRRPAASLREAGGRVVLVAPWAARDFLGRGGAVRVRSELSAGKASAADFDGVMVPGGYAPDRIRMRHAMVDLVRDATAAGKPVAAICRGPQVLISANVVRGRTLTCWPSIAVDVKNAGGLYVDRPVVVDGNLITSRKVDDLEYFLPAFVEALARPATGRPPGRLTGP